MRDFKEFLTGDVVVTFSSEEELKEFLKLCESKNITWHDGVPAIAYAPNFMSYGIRFDKYERGMWKGSLDVYKNIRTIKFIPASKFLFPEERVEIFRSKNTVVCLKRANGKVVAKGVARYNPHDADEGLPFNYDYGAELAFERMLGKKSVKTPKKTIVKQDVYAVGDIVLIKKKWKSSIAVPSMDFMLGNAYEVIEDKGEWSIKDGHQYRLKVCSGDIKYLGGYWDVCHRDIKGKVIGKPIYVKKEVYSVGDKVLIKKRCKYLDTVMTIREVVCLNSLTRYKMEEDRGDGWMDGWNWYAEDFKGKVVLI